MFSPLARLRAKQMIDLTKDGEISKQIPELSRMVIESLWIGTNTITVMFLDGTVKEVAI